SASYRLRRRPRSAAMTCRASRTRTGWRTIWPTSRRTGPGGGEGGGEPARPAPAVTGIGLYHPAAGAAVLVCGSVADDGCRWVVEGLAGGPRRGLHKRA